MLRSTDRMLGYTVSTIDGALGRLDDVYYDDHHWTIRYLVVGGIGEQGIDRLVSPNAVTHIGDESRQIALDLEREQVLEAPDIGAHLPVSLQAEQGYFDFFGWPYYWQGPYAWGAWAVPVAFAPAPPSGALLAPRIEAQRSADEAVDVPHHLRSSDETLGYHIQALDGEIGHVEDFLFDDDSWYLASLVVDTSNWWFGKKVAVPSAEFTKVDWEARIILVDETREQVKQNLEFDEDALPHDS